MITLESLSKRFGPKVLFEDVSMIFDPGGRMTRLVACVHAFQRAEVGSPLARSRLAHAGSRLPPASAPDAEITPVAGSS